MKELELEVRLSMNGVYEDTLTVEVEIPEDTKEDEQMGVMMDALATEMEEMYSGSEEWDNGQVSWTLINWKEI